MFQEKIVFDMKDLIGHMHQTLDDKIYKSELSKISKLI